MYMTAHGALQQFQAGGPRIDMHGKHMPSDRQSLRVVGHGPKQESTVRPVPEDQRTVARAWRTGKADGPAEQSRRR
jgi:hypothetical protein